MGPAPWTRRWWVRAGRGSDVMRLLALVWPDLRLPEAEPAPWEAMLDRLDDLSPRIEAVAGEWRWSTSRAWGRCSARSAASRRGRWRWPGGEPRCRSASGRGQPLAGGAGRAAGRTPAARCPGRLLAIPRRAGRWPSCPWTCSPPIRPRATLRAVRADRHGAAGHAAALGGRRPVRGAGERLQLLARGDDPRPLVPRRRPERLSRSIVFDPPAEGVTEIALALRRLREAVRRLRAATWLPAGRPCGWSWKTARPRRGAGLPRAQHWSRTGSRACCWAAWSRRPVPGAWARGGAADHVHRPGLRPPGRPGQPPAPGLRGAGRPLGGAALVAGADGRPLRRGPPVAGRARPAHRVAARAAGAAWSTSVHPRPP